MGVSLKADFPVREQVAEVHGQSQGEKREQAPRSGEKVRAVRWAEAGRRKAVPDRRSPNRGIGRNGGGGLPV